MCWDFIDLNTVVALKSSWKLYVGPDRVQARQAEFLFLSVSAFSAAQFSSLCSDEMLVLYILSKESCFILIK